MRSTLIIRIFCTASWIQAQQIHFTLYSTTNTQGQVRRVAAMSGSEMQPGKYYAFESSTNLVNWQPALPSFVSTGTVQNVFYLTTLNQSHKFFRLRLE